jgi:uncharacterized SAM-binding protein YcdF (DUF218 family)
MRKLLRAIILLSAAAFIGQVVTALPPVYRATWARFIPKHDPEVGIPDCIVVLGGGGIPSPSGLIRTYHASQVYAIAPGATFIVALPADGDPDTSSVGRMRDELVMRGVPSSSVRMETRGRNTREQAARVRDMLGDDALDKPTLIVTSPTHLRRSLMCFRKQGFTRVTGLTAESVGAEADLGRGTFLRYGLWANLQSEAEILREMISTVVYKLLGWA